MATLFRKSAINDHKARGWEYILLSMLIPAGLTLLVYLALGIVPFGSRSLMISDANGYYAPYLSYCKTIFSGEHGLFYSFSQDIGGGIAATIWPYLLNPFSWIFALVEYEAYPAAYTAGIIVTTALYGLSMYLLLRDIYGHRLENLLLSTVYAMSGFAVCFNINTAFFFSGPLCLPLMLLGLRKLFRGESPLVYALALAYPVMLQLQMGFAVCMASVLFFAAKLIVEEHGGERRELWLRYLFSSIVAGMLGAVVWVPELAVLRLGRAEMSLEDFVFTSNAPFLQFGARFFTGANSVSQISAGYPAIFCGILPLALVILFFLNKNIDKKRKYAYSVLLAIYLLGFYIRTFTSIFQAMTHANWFDYRFSFVFIFILLLIASEELDRLHEIETREIKICGISLLGFSLLVFFLYYEFVDGSMIVLDLALLAAMGMAFLFHKRAPDRAPQRVLVLFLFVCTFFQLYLNVYFCNKRVFDAWKDAGSSYEESLIKKGALVDAIKYTDNSFFRMESEQKLDGSIGNDSLFLDYNGVGFAGHTERSFVSLNLSRLGLNLWSGCWNSYDAGLPAATDSLLGIKYVLSERDLTEEKQYVRKSDLEGLAVYENPYTLPVALVSDSKIDDVTIEGGKNVFENLNNVWKGLTGGEQDLFAEETDITFSNHNPTDTSYLTYEDVVEMEEDSDQAEESSESVSRSETVSGSSEEAESAAMIGSSGADANRFKPYIAYSFTAKKTGPIYLYDYAGYIEGIGNQDDIMQYVGFFREGEEVSGKLYLNYTITEQLMIDTVRKLHICYADQVLLREYAEMVRARECTLVKESDSHLSGDVTTIKGQKLLFTIPHDEGWRLYINGKVCTLELASDLFMSAELGSGTYHYDLVFQPKGFSLGAVLSCVALLVLVFQCIVKVKEPSRRSENEEEGI